MFSTLQSGDYNLALNKVEKLVEIVHQEIEKIKNGDLKKEDLDKVLTSYLKDLKEEKEYTGYELNVMYDYAIEGYNRNDPKKNVDLINAVTPQDIQNLVETIMNGAESFEFIFKPKK